MHYITETSPPLNPDADNFAQNARYQNPLAHREANETSAPWSARETCGSLDAPFPSQRGTATEFWLGFC